MILNVFVVLLLHAKVGSLQKRQNGVACECVQQPHNSHCDGDCRAVAVEWVHNFCNVHIPDQIKYVNRGAKSSLAPVCKSFLTEVKEPNPHCAAGNVRQVKIINWAKAAHLVLDSMMWHLSDNAFCATTALLM